MPYLWRSGEAGSGDWRAQGAESAPRNSPVPNTPHFYADYIRLIFIVI